MKRRLAVTCAGAVGAFSAFGAFAATAETSAAPRGAGHFRLAATVLRAVDGDTLEARLAPGGRTNVRLIGIDTPERGACYGSEATAETRRLAQGKRVSLVGDASQAQRDRYGRLLAYVSLPDGRDLAKTLIGGGYGKVYVYDKAFVRLAAYRGNEMTAKRSGKGLWRACSRPAPAPARGSCDPAYPTVCIPSPPPDLDCGEIPHRNFKVLPPDPHRFDGNDGDGVGCES